VSVTDRAPEDWEVPDLHHRFIPPEVFDTKVFSDDFVAYTEADCGRYAYEFSDLLAPSRERSLVCVFPMLAESDAGIALQRREKSLGEFTCATVYFGCPFEASPALDEIGGSLSAYFEEHPDAWEAEVSMATEPWDLVIDGGLTEDDAFAKLEAFVIDAVEHKSHTGHHFTVKSLKPDVPPLSAEALYKVLAEDSKGFYHVVDKKAFGSVYENAQQVGFSDGFVAASSNGEVKKSFNRAQVEEVATRHLDQSDAAFDRTTFESFCENLAFEFGMKEELLVGACRFAEEGKLIMTSDMIALVFAAVPKKYLVGQKFHKSDFLEVCKRCKWLTKKFNEREAEKIFQQVMKKHPKKHPGTPIRRVNIGGHDALADRKKADEYIIHVASFEHLFELLADKKHMSGLKLLEDLQVAGNEARDALGADP
jgi:hypothetical protein